MAEAPRRYSADRMKKPPRSSGRSVRPARGRDDARRSGAEPPRVRAGAAAAAGRSAPRRARQESGPPRDRSGSAREGTGRSREGTRPARGGTGRSRESAAPARGGPGRARDRSAPARPGTPRPGAAPSRGRPRSAARTAGKATLKRPGVTPEAIGRILDRQPWQPLGERLRAAGVDPAPALGRLRRYAELLIQWNRSVSNLLSRNDEGRLIQRHIGESLGPVAELLGAGIDDWVDIGSGGGLPAIPLALVGVGRTWTLVESRRMKTLFLQKVKQELGLDNVDVICARIESLAREALPPEVRGVTSRATLHLVPTLHQASRFVASGGAAYLWKGERHVDEMRADASWRDGWRERTTIRLPDTPTSVVVFEKI